MGLTDVLFGRKKLKKAVEEKLFALSTARITLESDLGLKSAGSAAVVFKPLSAAEFVRAENELQELRDNAFEELVATVHLVASELVARGFGEQLLAAAFRFDGKHPVYWIYGFKRGAFWPFIPTGDGKERDNAEELELTATPLKQPPPEPGLPR